MKLSIKNAIFSMITFGLSGWLIGWLIFGLIGNSISALTDGQIGGARMGLIGVLSIGLLAGTIGGLNRGGSAVLKHYSLRFVLWVNGYTPFNFIKFLDHCAKLILLKKVGGGYMFIHRMFLEHFAKMEIKPTDSKKSK